MAANIFSRKTVPGRVARYLVVMCVLVTAGCHESHRFVVSGQVVDDAGRTLEGLHVTLETKTKTLDVRTDVDGNFSFETEFSAPEYDVGRTTATLRVIALDGNTLSLDVTPEKEPPRGADDRVRVLVVFSVSGVLPVKVNQQGDAAYEAH